jgi:hypothetical protein
VQERRRRRRERGGGRGGEEVRNKKSSRASFLYIVKATAGAPILWCTGGIFFLNFFYRNLKPEKTSISFLILRNKKNR